MNKSLFSFLLFLCAHSTAQEAPTVRELLLNKFETQFKEAIKEPQQYQKSVQTECGSFPEGQIFPYSLVAIGFCHRIYAAPERKDSLLPMVESLLILGEQSLRKLLSVADLTSLKGYQEQGTLLGNMTMALSSYRLAGGTNPKLVKLEKYWIAQFHKELTKRKGAPLLSYPELCWPFDTAPVLFAIELHDRVEETDLAGGLIADHFEWINGSGLDKKSLLPCSQVLANQALVESRGCDLSWRLALYSELDKDKSTRLYQRYSRDFWINAMISQGFKEWADPKKARMDLDSGPIVAGIGSTATVLGLASTQAHKDKVKTDILIQQAQLLANARTGKGLMAKMLVQTMDDALRQSSIKVNQKYVTGFLFGDVATFYALSWTDYPQNVPLTRRSQPH